MTKTSRKPIFVVIIPRFQDIFHSFYAGEVIKGVNLAACRLNVNILTHIVDCSSHEDWLDPAILSREAVDGILFADIDGDVQTVKKAIQSGMPCLVLNNIIEEPINTIAIDNEAATFKVISNLIQQGHTKIATITGDLDTQAAQLRLKGYKKALTKKGIEINPKYIKEGDFMRSKAAQMADRLLRLKDRPTAIFAASDVMALEVLDVAKKLKIAVPKDLSVIGFDDNPINITSPIKLETVAQPLVEMGRLGLENLHQISHGKAKLPVKKMLSAQHIKGKTVSSL